MSAYANVNFTFATYPVFLHIELNGAWDAEDNRASVWHFIYVHLHVTRHCFQNSKTQCSGIEMLGVRAKGISSEDDGSNCWQMDRHATVCALYHLPGNFFLWFVQDAMSDSTITAVLFMWNAQNKNVVSIVKLCFFLTCPTCFVAFSKGSWCSFPTP